MSLYCYNLWKRIKNRETRYRRKRKGSRFKKWELKNIVLEKNMTSSYRKRWPKGICAREYGKLFWGHERKLKQPTPICASLLLGYARPSIEGSQDSRLNYKDSLRLNLMDVSIQVGCISWLCRPPHTSSLNVSLKRSSALRRTFLPSNSVGQSVPFDYADRFTRPEPDRIIKCSRPFFSFVRSPHRVMFWTHQSFP